VLEQHVPVGIPGACFMVNSWRERSAASWSAGAAAQRCRMAWFASIRTVLEHAFEKHGGNSSAGVSSCGGVRHQMVGTGGMVLCRMDC